MKAPKLKPNETTKSFKKRVAEWERVTGKKYPTTFSGQSNEERVLTGGSQNFGLNKPQNYYDKEYQDQIREVERLNVKVPSTEDLEEDYLSKLARGEVDPLQEPNPIPINQNDLTTQAVNREKVEIPGEGDESTTAELPSDSDEVSQALLQEKMDGIQQALKDYFTEKGASHGRKVLDNIGNKAYTTNFQEAMRHANNTQAWEDTINTDAPLEKSNVFTVDPDTGLPLGVMTRNQRRVWDEANARKKQQAMADEATGGSGVYGEKDTKGQGTLTEWTTDQEVNEGGVKIETPQSAKKDMSKHSNPETSFKPAKDNKRMIDELRR